MTAKAKRTLRTRKNGRDNICGLEIAKRRNANEPHITQKDLAEKLQLLGMDVDKNAIHMIEKGKRFVTDIELEYFAKVFGISIADLYPKE